MSLIEGTDPHTINEDQIDISVAESHLDLSTEQLIQEDASTIKDLETTVTIEDASFICDICQG